MTQIIFFLTKEALGRVPFFFHREKSALLLSDNQQ